MLKANFSIAFWNKLQLSNQDFTECIAYIFTLRLLIFFDEITNLNVVVAMLIALWSSLFCQSKFLGCFSRRKFCFNIGWAIILTICITVFSVEWKHRLKILNFCRTSKGLNRLHQLQLHWISSSQSFVFHPRNNFSDWWFSFQFVLQ